MYTSNEMERCDKLDTTTLTRHCKFWNTIFLFFLFFCLCSGANYYDYYTSICKVIGTVTDLTEISFSFGGDKENVGIVVKLNNDECERKIINCKSFADRCVEGWPDWDDGGNPHRRTLPNRCRNCLRRRSSSGLKSLDCHCRISCPELSRHLPAEHVCVWYGDFGTRLSPIY